MQRTSAVQLDAIFVSKFSRYSLAVIAVFATVALRAASAPWLGERMPLLLFLLAIMLAARYGGLGPGLTATVLSLFHIWFVILSPNYSFKLENRADALNLVLFVGVGVGITVLSHQLRQAVQLSTRAERATAALLESASQGIIGVTAAGRIAIVNAMTERMFGYQREELHGQALEILIPEGHRGVHTAHRQAFHADQRARTMGFGLDLRGRRKDGTEFPAEVSLSSVQTEDGSLSVAFVTDISERKHAEEALREQAQLLNIANDPIFTWVLGGAITYWSRGAELLYGFTAEEAIGRVSHELLQTVRAISNGELEALLARDGQWSGEMIHTRKNGTRVDIECLKLVYPRPSGVRMVLETTRDITERKRAAEEIQGLNASLERRVHERTAQLEAANKELEAFAYSVSHDLRAPLRGIDGWSLALLEDYGEQLDERAKGYLTRVRAETQRLGQLIDDLLQLSRVTRVQIERQPVDLSALANQIAERLHALNPARAIEFVIQRGMAAEGDSRLLEVVLWNLLENAVKFTSTRPHALIEIAHQEGNDANVFYVRDNGVGFDMTYASTLFGVFQRLHKPSEFPGTGIGLATVQRIIHRHGGRVSAKSVPDQGSIFYFTVPL